jgi:hypothetical protein
MALTNYGKDQITYGGTTFNITGPSSSKIVAGTDISCNGGIRTDSNIDCSGITCKTITCATNLDLNIVNPTANKDIKLTTSGTGNIYLTTPSATSFVSTGQITTNGKTIYAPEIESQQTNLTLGPQGQNNIILKTTGAGKTVAMIIKESCEKLNINISGLDIYGQSQVLLDNLNANDKEIIKQELAVHQQINTLS